MVRSGMIKLKKRRDRSVGLQFPAISHDMVLEKRELLATNIVKVIDFKPINGGVLQVDYQLLSSVSDNSNLTFDVYRSSDSSYDATDKWISAIKPDSRLNQPTLPQSATADLGTAMRPDPSRPFVIVVARASGAAAETDLSDNSSAFRKYTIAVISHGGIQGSHYNIPEWEAKLARQMQSFGYDAVIPFNWANKSRTPGAAAKQAPRMAKRILAESAALPTGASIDLDYIAHSEGTVVVTQASMFLQKNASAPFQTGYQRMSLLDPHAANPEAPNNAESTAGGFSGWLTNRIISWYKGNARDPLVQIPNNINEADVYYQRTPVTVNPVNGGLYNLLGQVPVIGSARYVQLNSPGIAHSGGGGVYTWFYFNALPSFATGDQPKNPGILESTSVQVSSGNWNGDQLLTTDTRPVWSGVGTPNSIVKLYLTPASGKLNNSRPVATTQADTNGHWQLQPVEDVRAGAYHVNIRGFLDSGQPTPYRKLMPSIRLGTLKIPGNHQFKSVRLQSQPIPLGIPSTLNKNGIGLKLTNEIQTFQPKPKP